MPEGLPPLMIFEVSALTVAGVMGSKELVATVTAPPRRVVSRPPLAVVRVAQPELKRTAEVRAARRRSFDFMGGLKVRRCWDAGGRRKFRKIWVEAGVGRSVGAGLTNEND